MSNIHVAVLMGGWSAEREVSLNSGAACAKALESEGYRVTSVDVDRDIAARLAEMRPDVAFNALHGKFGEDGCIQGILETMNISYTHSGVLASALAMHKEQARRALKAGGVPVAPGMVVDRMEAGRAHVMSPPYVIKPLDEGSSVGVFIVGPNDSKPPAALIDNNWGWGDSVLVERYIPGRELTCAVMGDQILGVIEIIPRTRFYDYEAKYASGGSDHVLPAKISPNIYQFARKLTGDAHRALGCRGVSRTDFRYDENAAADEQLMCLEVNTQPGMTETSLVPELAAEAGYSFGALVRWMVEDASCSR